MTTTERIELGLGVSFQNPPAIRGVKLKDLLNIETSKKGMNPLGKELSPETIALADKLKLNDQFLERDVNLGFSGGEVKRSEILQLLAQQPDFIMFDEPDSGVDIENVELLAEEINVLLDKDKKPGLREKSGLLITHLGYILNFVGANTAHVLMDGKIACSGDPNEILEDIRKEGFKGCVECCKIQ
jgi:Fe-S cluster assembly ATP-binding protein